MDGWKDGWNDRQKDSIDPRSKDMGMNNTGLALRKNNNGWTDGRRGRRGQGG